MRYGSICSGIEAATVAWEPFGWTPAWFAEIEPFPCSVLAHHYPEVPNYGDMTKLAGRIRAGEVEAPDLLVGGTPCQAFSVAGLRKGLNDERGQLTPAFALLADAIDEVRAAEGKPPVIIVWENVPGVLSDKDNAYGCFLGLLAGEDIELRPPGGRWTNAGLVLGPTRQVAWRILDAQYFGVAQRRRRVFVVASAGGRGVHPAQVLFIEPGMRRDSPPSREARQVASSGVDLGFEVCGTLSDGAHHGGGLNGQDAYTGRILPVAFDTMYATQSDVAGPLDAHYYKGPGSRQGGEREYVVASVAVRGREGGATIEVGDDVAGCMRASQGGADKPHALVGMSVRRLTPVECERLQGFPDDYTRIPWRGKAAEECPDGPRYKALGNSMAVPVMRWIGNRINNRSQP